MSLKSRYDTVRNVYEIGYYVGSKFVIVVTQKAI